MPAGPGWQFCWSLSFAPSPSSTCLQSYLAYHPCSFARLSPAALQRCVLSQRFGVICLSFHFHHGPSAVSLVVLLFLFLHLFVCQCLSGCRSARGRQASTGTMCIHNDTVALFSSPGRGAVRLHAKPAHTRQVALRCFPLSCYSHPSACSSRAGTPSTTVALCFPLPKSHVPWPAPPSTRRPGGLTDARCLLLHRRRRGAGHVTPRTYLAV